MVCPEGECSGAIQKSSPAMSQYLGGLQVGDISFLVGVNLPCQYVIHTRCSNWNGGRGEEVGITMLTYRYPYFYIGKLWEMEREVRRGSF